MNQTGRWILLVVLMVLAGCVPVRQMFGMQRKSPVAMPNGTQLHETWCYRTLAEADCYDRAQDVDGGNLISVDPPLRIPMTHDEYAQRVAESR